MKRDREPLNGRPMFISPSEPDAAMKHPVFKYHTTLEKKKLFVKGTYVLFICREYLRNLMKTTGLSRSTTKEQVEELFSQYGTVKDARLVTFKSGVPKGLLKIDFIYFFKILTSVLIKVWHMLSLKMKYRPRLR